MPPLLFAIFSKSTRLFDFKSVLTFFTRKYNALPIRPGLNSAMVLVCALALSLPATPVSADGSLDIIRARSLFFDQPLPGDFDFDIKDPLIPSENDFEIEQAAFLSNQLGERFALITLLNLSSSQRLLKNETIVVTFANGKQAFAKNLDEVFRGRERQSLAIFFGISQFPIVQITVDRERELEKKRRRR